MLRTNLAVGVAGAVFGIAGEMRRLPAYFDNPGVSVGSFPEQWLVFEPSRPCPKVISISRIILRCAECTCSSKRRNHPLVQCKKSSSIVVFLLLFQVNLFSRVRLAKHFPDYEKRLQCIQARLQAISVLCK